MNRLMTVVMYHYVRNFSRTRFPGIKGLDIRQFKAQVAYFQKNYTFVSYDHVRDHIYNGVDLPEKPILLTFDDGYSDHYQYVFPVLDELKIKACFFPPAQAVLEHKLLDVNKIHFTLASTEDHAALLKDAFDLVEDEEGVDVEAIRKEYFTPNRYDGPEVNCFKRMFQKALPETLRERVLSKIFEKYVTKDERAFAEELYLSVDQLKTMLRHGMTIGSHGDSHCWMDTLSKEDQEKEIIRSLDFLTSLGVKSKDWSICYPYGAHNQSLRNLVEKHGGTIGFTTVPQLSLLSRDEALTLARLDTNDFPKD